MGQSPFFIVKKDGKLLLQQAGANETTLLKCLLPKSSSDTCGSEKNGWRLCILPDGFVTVQLHNTHLLTTKLACLNQDEKIHLQALPTSWCDIIGMVVFIVFAMIVLALGVASFYPVFIKRTFHPHIVIHNKMSFNKKMHPDDVFCIVRGDKLDCSSIPLWITNTELFDPFNAYLPYMMLQENGNLEFFAGSNIPFWSSNTQGRKCFHIRYLGNDEWKLECNVGGDVIFKKSDQGPIGPQGVKGPPGPVFTKVEKLQLLPGDFIDVGERLCSKDLIACVELKDDGTFEDVRNSERVRTNGLLKANFLSEYHRYTCTMDKGFLLQSAHEKYDSYENFVIFFRPCEKITLTNDYRLHMDSNGYKMDYPLFV